MTGPDPEREGAAMAEKKTAGIGKGTPGPGRKPGVPNKSTQEFRDTVRKLLEDNAQNVGEWLGAVALEDPARALDLLAKLAEFAAPKLGRVEHVGDGGGPVEQSLTVEFIDARAVPGKT